MYTLNSVEVHAVCYGVDLYNQSITGDKAKCITSKASDADHIPCVCYGLDTYNQNAEEELMPTIRTNGGGDCIPKVAYSIDKAITTGANCTAGGDCFHEEYAPPLTTDRPHAVAYGFDNYNLCLTGEVGKTLQAEGGGSGVNEGCVVIENHPNDSRVKLSKDNVVQALTSRMGTGGGNVPLVMEKK